MKRRLVLAVLACLVAAPSAHAEMAWVTGSALRPTVVVADDSGKTIRKFPNAGFSVSLADGGVAVAWMAYTSRSAGTITVAQPADGSIIATFEDAQSPELSPNGQLLAFSPPFGTRKPGLYIADLTTGGITRVGGHDVQRIAWAPDGTWMAFDSKQNETSSRSDIYRVGADGTGLKRLTRNGVSLSPSISEDAKRIVYTEAPPPRGISCDGRANLATMKATGGGRKLLTSKTFRCPVFGYAGAVFANAKRIVSFLGGDDFADVVTVGAGGGAVRKLTNTGRINGFAVSPDGGRLLYGIGGEPWSRTSTLYLRALGATGKGRVIARNAYGPVWTGPLVS